ncbi:MAG: hypothetical protein ABR507_09915 [Actinomycetota bacterium]
MKHLRSLALIALFALIGTVCVSASAYDPSLPTVTSGHRPGPDALYLPAADAPQLQNTGPWQAPPILVSGAAEYLNGEHIYQDFLYDDHGAAGGPDLNAPIGANAFLFAPSAGTFTYPTDAAYANNAADLVEFRVKPLSTETALRITLNTLKDPSLIAATVAIGGTPGIDVAWPHGAGVSSPAKYFLTVHGTTAELTDAGTADALMPAPSTTVDMTRRQIDVRIPHETWNPALSTVRMTIGIGLWNGSSGTYLAPDFGPATPTIPGGAAPTKPAIVNVGPRLNEPNPDLATISTWTLGDSAVGAAQQARWWRERAQADALQLGDVSSFFEDIDFAKLSANVNDDSQVPKTGPLNRILASHYSFGQGFDPTKVCYDIGSQFSAGASCIGRLVGQLQPYSLYVPNKPQPASGWGMTLLLHSLSANQNQYSASRNQSELGERGGGSVVLTPSGRGPDGFYAGVAEADTFEAWADVARHYTLDPEWATVSGYSMGGFGTYRLLARYPDLFSAGFSTVGIPGAADPMLASLRNTPIFTWNDVGDELVRIDQSEATVKSLTALGLRFTSWLFPASDHLTLATNDEYAPAAGFLGSTKVDRNPTHVTFVVNPSQDSSFANAVADHAYWLSNIVRRDGSISTGTIDVRSEGFGLGDPAVLPISQGAGTLNGGNHGPMAYVERTQGWSHAPATVVNDTLNIKATNIGTLTIDPLRSHVDCAVHLNVLTDGPLTVLIEGCGTFNF